MTNANRVPLYGTTTAAGIECGSCHDVHRAYGNANLLNIPNNASNLCRTCHNK